MTQSSTEPLNDIFISYAHVDNESLTEGQKGWISQFHRTLEIRLRQLLGENPRIWRDMKLSGTDIFDEKIVNAFGNNKTNLAKTTHSRAMFKTLIDQIKRIAR